MKKALLLCGLFALMTGPNQNRCYAVDAWPLFEHSKDNTTVLYPFYVREGKFLMMFPFYYRTNEGHDQHFVWPLVKISDGRPTRIAPIWFSEKQGEFTLFPLIDETPEHIFWSVPPVYVKRDGSFMAVFPFWVKTREKLFVLPYYQNRSKKWHSQGIAPVWYSGHNPDDPTASTLWLFPYLQRSLPSERKTALYPLFSHSTEKYEPGKPDKLTKIHSRELNILWPLYHRRTEFDENGKVIARERQFLIFSDKLERDGRRGFSILGFLINERT